MKRVCAWCDADLGTKESGILPDDAVTHGMCPACETRLLPEVGDSTHEFLDRLGVPVLLMEADARVRSANKYARAILGKELPKIEGEGCGDVIACPNARLPEGCGYTVHCKDCSIRNAVLETFETGKSIVRRSAYPDIERAGGIKKMRILISTEKAGEIVLLRIDDIREERPGDRD
ncbi:MAG: hypothetical protein ABII00_18780 [Elusimicrobiota bacterium]